MAVNGHDSDAPTEGQDTAGHTAHAVQESFAHELDYGNSTSSWLVTGTVSSDSFSRNIAHVWNGPNNTSTTTTATSPGSVGHLNTVAVNIAPDGFTVTSPTPVTFRLNTPVAAGRYNARINLPQINVPLNVFVFSVGLISEDLKTFIDLTPADIITAATTGFTQRTIAINTVALFGNGTRFFPQFTYFDLREVVLNALDFVTFQTI